MKKFSGVLTALATPFQDGSVDYKSLQRLVEFQVAKKIDGFVINGTTAESPTLTKEEKKKIFEVVKKNSKQKMPLIFGSGSNNTQQTIEDSRWAEKIGADAVLVVVPYYNKPPQRGLFEHFKKVAESIDIPVILYNVPSRTVTGLELETIQKLSQHPNIVGIKEATGNMDFAKQIRDRCGKEFLLLSGDDGTYDRFMSAGGDGVISVASHIIPQTMQERKIKENLKLIDLLFCEANPIPVKMALHLMGIFSKPELRLPLVELGSVLTGKLKLEMKRKKLI